MDMEQGLIHESFGPFSVVCGNGSHVVRLAPSLTSQADRFPMGLRVVAMQTHPSVVGRIRLWTHPKPPIAARHAPAPALERERNSGLFLPPPWRSLPLVDWIKLIQHTML